VRRATDPWSLPAARQFLTEVEPLIWRGGAVISSDASTPPKLAERLVSHLRDVATVERLTPAPGALPLAILSDAFGQAGASIAAIVASGRCFLIEAQDLPAADLPGWTRVLADFVAKSASSDEGGAMLFLGEAEVPGMARLEWRNRLRRVDAMIWAEYAVPPGYAEILQRLAVDLAVELCGWRLDLVADLVSQRQEDILDPMGWLQRNADQAIATPASFGPAAFACPLHLLVKGALPELSRRIWKAQLSVLFPWIEGHRQRLIARYRKHLYLDEHLRALGVVSVEDIELGGLRYQLAPILSRAEADRLEALTCLRNNLAHRKPIRPADFTLANQIA
jgi:hypothetical protein